MNNTLKLAVAGVGNNVSALVQGIQFYKKMAGEGHCVNSLPGIRHFSIGGINVYDIEIVAAFDIDENKVGRKFAEAIFLTPNNYPKLDVDIPSNGLLVEKGLKVEGLKIKGKNEVIQALERSGAEVLLYALPTGLQTEADSYAECALEAGTGFVNCTPEVVARSDRYIKEFQKRGLSIIGDDLASHMGTSTIHRSLLNLLIERGLDLESTYQINLGGNEDFRNLKNHGDSKATSKKNAVNQDGLDVDKVHVIPSAGYVSCLEDKKVAYLNIVGRGWGNTPIMIDMKLEVQDSSNAAGVIIDLVRICAASQRIGLAGYNKAAGSFLKSPPGGHQVTEKADEERAFHVINEGVLKKVV